MIRSREIDPKIQSDIEQAYEMHDAKTELEARHRRKMHHLFGSKAKDSISGRPHRLGVWFGGILTHLGYRRR